MMLDDARRSASIPYFPIVDFYFSNAGIGSKTQHEVKPIMLFRKSILGFALSQAVEQVPVNM